MSHFHDFLLYRTLTLRFSRENSTESLLQLLTMSVGENGEALTPDQIEELLQLVQVCARLPRHLNHRLDDCSESLGTTKRDFIEQALLQAVNDAENMLAEVVGGQS